MIMSRYFIWRFVKVVTQVVLIFFGILLLLDMVEQMRRFSDKSIGLMQAMELSLLNVPASLYRILPLTFVLASIALFLALSRSSELVVVRAAGRSGLRFLVAPVGAAFVIGVAMVAVFNPLVAATSKKYDHVYSALAYGGDATISVSEGGLWLRQGSHEGQVVIHAQRAAPDGTLLYGASFLIHDPNGQPIRRIEAQEAQLGQGAWALRNTKSWDLREANPELSASIQAEARLASDLTADGIRDSFGTPSAIPVWALPAYIDRLEKAGFSARSYRVWLQMELALPLLLASMVLVAAGFTMRHARGAKVGQMVLYAIVGGFALFFLRNFAQVLGDNGQIPVALAAWTPPVAAVLVSLGLLLHLEDG